MGQEIVVGLAIIASLVYIGWRVRKSIMAASTNRQGGSFACDSCKSSGKGCCS